MKQKPTSIRIEEALLEKLSKTAEQTKRSKNQIIGLALKEYLNKTENHKEQDELKPMIEKLVTRVNILSKQLDNTQKRITNLEKKNG